MKIITHCVFLLVLLSSFAAHAETLTDLQKELLQNNPEIAAARNRYLAATKVPAQEGTLPDPMLSFTDFGVSHPFSNLNESDFAYRSFGVMQEFPFPGKLDLRKRIAQKGVEAAEQNVRFTEIRLQSELKKHSADYLYLQQAIAISEQYRDLLTQLNEITEVRYKVGKGLQQDLLRAQVERSAIEEKLELLKQDLKTAQAAIHALVNRNLEQPLILEGDLAQPAFTTPLQTLQRQLESRSPEVIARLKLEEQSKLRIQLAQKGKLPDFGAAFQWQRTGSNFPDYYMTTFQMSIPIFSRRKTEAAVAQATLESQAAKNDTQATLLKLKSDLNAAYLNAETNATLIKLYNEGIIPQTRLSLESATNAYQSGQIEFLSLLNNAATLLNYESEYHRRLADYHKAIARIEELVGEKAEFLPLMKGEIKRGLESQPPPNPLLHKEGESAGSSHSEVQR